MSIWTILGLAAGGTLFFEGVMWALAPNATRDAYRRLVELPGATLQMAGLASAGLGVLVFLLVLR